jgi:Autophagy protein Apg5
MQVHFRGSAADVLTPCEGEESVKWSYINSLKEVIPSLQNLRFCVMYFGILGEKWKY